MKQPAKPNGLLDKLKRAASRGVAVRASRVAFQKELQLETDIEQAKEEVRDLRERARKEKDKKERKRLVAAAAKAHTRGVRAAARLNKAKAKRLSTALRVADVYANPAQFDAPRKPHFCADCEKPLQAGRMAVMGDGRVVCSSCEKKAKDKGAAKRQQALFGADAVPMDTTGMLFNPRKLKEPVVADVLTNAKNGKRRVHTVVILPTGYKVEFTRRVPRNDAIKAAKKHEAITKSKKPNPAHLTESSQYPIKVQGYCIPTHYRARRIGSTGEKAAAKKPAHRTTEKKPKAKATRAKRKEKFLSISQWVRAHGGIKPDRDGDNAGEVRGLSNRETGTTGIVSKKGKSADRLAESAAQFYPLEPSGHALIEAVQNDLRGKKMWPNDKDDWDYTDTRGKAKRGEGWSASDSEFFDTSPRWARANPKRFIRTKAQLAKLYTSNPAAQGKLFQFPVDESKLAETQRVQSVDRDRSGNYPRGVVVGQMGEFYRVLFDGFDRPHLVVRGLLKKVNPARARKSNKAPKPSGATKRKFEAFTGREASRVEQVPCSHLYDQVKGYELGKLIELQTADGKVYKGKGLRLLATAHNKMTIGGKPLFPVNFKLRDDQVLAVSPIVHVVYRQFKPGVGDNKTENYIHLLAEDTGEKDRPWLGRDRYGWAILHGGKYRIEERGIVN